MINAKEAIERSQKVVQIKTLITQGNGLVSEGVRLNSKRTVDRGVALLKEAQSLREEFWKRFPNAVMLHNCGYMSKTVKLF